MENSQFEIAVAGILDHDLRSSVVEVDQIIELAKKSLLNHRVQNFTAADVVSTASMILANKYQRTAIRQSPTKSPAN